MEKFENVDVIAALDAILHQNTGYYQEQFKQVEKAVTEAATSPAHHDKSLLWVSAPAGTCCVSEKDLLIQENLKYGRFGSYAEGVRLDGDKALCYAVELSGVEVGRPKGTIYRLDYLEHLAHLNRVVVPAAAVIIIGRDAVPRRFPYAEYKENEPRILKRFGPLQAFTYEPKSKATLARLMRQEHGHREQEARPAILQGHIRQLAVDKVEAEAGRIVSEFGRLWNPNGGEGCFMVQVSPVFLNLATDTELKQLAALLPYQSLTITKRADGTPGLFAFISKDENREEPPRRSVLEKLKQRPAPEAPKRPPHKAGPERS